MSKTTSSPGAATHHPDPQTSSGPETSPETAEAPPDLSPRSLRPDSKQNITPVKMLALQRTIGNQAVLRLMVKQARFSKPALLQRHPSHAEEQEVDRVIARQAVPPTSPALLQRHPWHAEEQEVDRVIARQPSAGGIHLQFLTGRRQPNPERAGRPTVLERSFGPHSSYPLMRKPPTTDELNQKFKRTTAARFQIYVEQLVMIAGALTNGTAFQAGEITKALKSYNETLQALQDEVVQCKKDGNDQKLAILNPGLAQANQLVSAKTSQQKGVSDIAQELSDLLADLTLLAKLKSPADDDVKKLPLVEQQLTVIENKINSFNIPNTFNGNDQAELAQAKSAIASLDTVVGAGFGSDMRHKVDKVYSALPSAHVGGNASLVGINYGQKMEGLGQASGYDYGNKRIAIVLPDNPITGKPLGEGTFTGLKRSNGLIRAVMDLGAAEEYKGVEGTSGDKFKALYSGKRSIFSGKKTAKSQHMGKLVKSGTLVNWIIRHEMGHSVDTQIKFTKTRGKVDVFGGWREYEADQIKEVVQAMLSKGATLSYDQPMIKGGKHLGEMFLDVFKKDHTDIIEELNKMKSDAQAPAQASLSASGQFKTWLKAASGAQLKDILAALDWALTALAQPWMFADGASDKLAVNGRVYQMDHYGTWVSYLENARANALSSYQFSSPGEWFAEAYAAFYDPRGASKTGLHPAVVEWFKKNLGKTGDQGKASLTKGGNLGSLDDMDDKLASSAEIKKAKTADLPEDLKKIVAKI